MEHAVWAEIDLGAISHNLGRVKEELLPDTGIIAVVKANAYGHGLVPVSRVLEQGGADMIAITSIEEGVALRKAGITIPILNLSYTAAKEVPEAIERRITVTVYDSNSADILHEQAKVLKKPLRVHLKIDTGMSRLGIVPNDVLQVVPKIVSMPYFRVDGMYSHFADESDANFVQQQYQTMQDVLFSLQRVGCVIPAVHMAKSGVIFQSKDYHFDAVRPGIALYGSGHGADSHGLEPALALKTVLAQVKKIPAGARVGYMQTFTAKKDMTIAIVPIGYAHGYDRDLSNKGYMLVDDWLCPVIGRVCMSQTILDVSAVKSRLTIGEEVVVIGKQKKNAIAVRDVASQGNSIGHEVLAPISVAVPRG